MATKLSPRVLAAMGAGFVLGGSLLKTADADSVGPDDKIGAALAVGGGALSQLSSGATVGKNLRAADALDLVGDSIKEYARELRGE